ncbi:uncharacterized protein V6R79_004620 [Siganus canaliculatus]
MEVTQNQNLRLVSETMTLLLRVQLLSAERTDRQRALEGSRHNIQQKIQEREKDLKLLQQEVKAMTRSADETVEDSQKIFTQMISLLEQRRRDVEQQVRSKQEAELLLSEGNRGAALGGRQDYPEHPDRFSYWQQVLSGQGLTGRCYWEVEWSGPGLAYVSAAYRSIGRTGTSNQSRFGFNACSWALSYYNHRYNLWADKVHTAVPGPRCSRVGVYLDHGAGVLAFYSVSAEQTMTLIHRVQTRFTQPLHPGLWLCLHGTTARFCQPD